MAVWDVDLETRMGAQSAADQAGLAAFVFAGLTVVSGFFLGSMMDLATPEGMTFAAIILFQIVLGVAAGIRLRQGHGAWLGIAMAVVIGANVLLQAVSLQLGLGLIINVLLLVWMVQGIRGAVALRKGQFDEDAYEAFE